MKISEALEEYLEQIREEMKRVEECRCEKVRQIVKEILEQPYLEVRGDDYGLVQIWCTICDDGITFHKPVIRKYGDEYYVE